MPYCWGYEATNLTESRLRQTTSAAQVSDFNDTGDPISISGDAGANEYNLDAMHRLVNLPRARWHGGIQCLADFCHRNPDLRRVTSPSPETIDRDFKTPARTSGKNDSRRTRRLLAECLQKKCSVYLGLAAEDEHGCAIHTRVTIVVCNQHMNGGIEADIWDKHLLFGCFCGGGAGTSRREISRLRARQFECRAGFCCA